MKSNAEDLVLAVRQFLRKELRIQINVSRSMSSFDNDDRDVKVEWELRLGEEVIDSGQASTT